MKNEENPLEENSLLKNIEQSLLGLQDLNKNDRRSVYVELFDYLGHTKYLSLAEYDAFLIKSVNQVFGESTIDADIVLMALGLLDGYSYNVILRHIDRRIKFLRETTYIDSKKPPYDEASKTRQESYEKRIREDGENPRLRLLAKFLEDNQGNVDKFLVDINNYIDGKKVILPIPGYIKADNARRKVKEAVIKYLYSGEEVFTERQEIVIKNNECQIEVDLSKKSANKLTRIIPLTVLPLVLIFVLAGFRVTNHVQNLGSNPPQSSDMGDGWTAADAKSDKNL